MAKREFITPPNNSFKEKAKKPGVEIPKMVPGSVQETKKSVARKLADTFISEDATSASSYIFSDVIVPMIKDLIVSAINQGIEILFYGRSGGGYHGNSKGKYGTASYQSYYSGGSKSQSSGAPTRDTSEITFDTRKLAWDVLEEMRAVVEQYDNLSIVDYHDIVEKVTGFCPSSNYTDDRYGWTDLSRVDVKMVRGGRYVLTLPKAVLLE